MDIYLGGKHEGYIMRGDVLLALVALYVHSKHYRFMVMDLYEYKHIAITGLENKNIWG